MVLSKQKLGKDFPIVISGANEQIKTLLEQSEFNEELIGYIEYNKTID